MAIFPDECDMRHLYKKCERCTEAVLEDFFDDHIASEECVRKYTLAK